MSAGPQRLGVWCRKGHLIDEDGAQCHPVGIAWMMPAEFEWDGDAWAIVDALCRACGHEICMCPPKYYCSVGHHHTTRAEADGCDHAAEWRRAVTGYGPE